MMIVEEAEDDAMIVFLVAVPSLGVAEEAAALAAEEVQATVEDSELVVELAVAVALEEELEAVAD